MRWFWIDRYVEFESGQHASAIKNVSLAEEHLHDHFPCAPTMPNSLILEGIAQTGGLLVAEVNDFTKRVVLAKVAKVKFHLPAVPGDTLIYRTKIEQITPDGAMISATAHIGERLQAEAELFFAHLNAKQEERELFHPSDMLSWLNMLRVFEVGRTKDGAKLKVPNSLKANVGTVGVVVT